MMGYYGYNDYIPFEGSFGFLGPVLMMLFWAAIIILIVYLVREGYGMSCKQGGHRSTRALDILKERYAKGEIKKEEFEAMKKDLI